MTYNDSHVRLDDIAPFTNTVDGDRLRRIASNHDAILEERTRIAREMHDGLLQNVTGIALQLRALLPRLRSDPEKSAADLERILELVERTSTEARLAVVGMRRVAPNSDLVTALRNTAEYLLEESGLLFSVSVHGTTHDVSPMVCDAATLIVRHAITNVLRHAEARSVQLSVEFGVRSLRIRISDDGRGFVADDAHAPHTHFGLLGMRERAREIGGQLRIRSAPMSGTTVTISMPSAAA